MRGPISRYRSWRLKRALHKMRDAGLRAADACRVLRDATAALSATVGEGDAAMRSFNDALGSG